MAAVSQEYTSGYAGATSVDATAVPITSWNATLACPSFDATNSTSSGWQKRGRTIKSLNGTFTALWAETAGEPQFNIGSIYATVLTVKSGVTYTFNAYIASIAISEDIKGNVSYTCSFESDGAVTDPT